MSLSNEKSSLGQREKAEMNNKTSQRYREKTNKSAVKNKERQADCREVDGIRTE